MATMWKDEDIMRIKRLTPPIVMLAVISPNLSFGRSMGQISREGVKSINGKPIRKEGVHIIVTPRATPQATSDKWLVGERATAVVSGAYSLSSNHVSFVSDPVHFGGQGWIIGPEGEVLGLTSQERPFVTIEIALEVAEMAKHTYARYIFGRCLIPLGSAARQLSRAPRSWPRGSMIISSSSPGAHMATPRSMSSSCISYHDRSSSGRFLT